MGGYGKKQEFKRFDSKSNWNNFPTQSPVRFRNDGFPTGMDNATISYAKWCQESIKAAGNAIVPQVALEIFKAIEAYENR
jgi:DNA (cytosine-5)-methyltransferase 1